MIVQRFSCRKVSDPVMIDNVCDCHISNISDTLLFFVVIDQHYSFNFRCCLFDHTWCWFFKMF